jgi:hypothetical protein
VRPHTVNTNYKHMRIKALLCAAALAAGAITSMAQSNVYSLNVVGYVNTSIVGSGSGDFQMIANPLNTTNNTIGALIPTAPDFTALFKWTGTAFATATFFAGSWDHPEYTLAPGEGAITQSTSPWTNTFVGEVLQSVGGAPLANAYPAGLSIRASMVPQQGTLTQLGLPGTQLTDFDAVFEWNTTTKKYDTFTWFAGAWDTEPSLAVGQSMWLQVAAAGTWNRVFTVQ